MKCVYVIFLVILTVSCSGHNINSKAVTKDSVNNEVGVLIISPQGIDPKNDLIGFNKLVKGVTESFSEALSKQLIDRGVKALSIIDQNPKLNLGQKIFNHTKNLKVQAVIVLTLDMITDGNDKQLLLIIQKAPLEFNEVERTIKIGVVDEKSYVLSSSESGYYKGTMADISDDYIKSLESIPKG